MQRAAFDLVGIASDADDQRPWLWMASWPIDQFPLRRDFVAQEKWQPGEEEYAFVKVEGDGVHEIPVGPVHAGIIEPGHFRFQVVGEKVLRLEERLGWVHKGIEKRFESAADRRRRAPRGTRVGRQHGGVRMVVRASARVHRRHAGAAARAWLRALLLERERIANHLGDLGYLGNDAGFAFGLAQFSRLKEDVLRTNRDAFGHRLLMDASCQAGVACDLSPEHAGRMREECAAVAREVRIVRDIYDEHAGVQDRFRNCGRVTPELARKLGLTGLAGRASGQAFDLRCDFPAAPYDALAVRKAGPSDGDVAARVAIRFDEVAESLRLIRALLEGCRRATFAHPWATSPSTASASASSKAGAARYWSRSPAGLAAPSAAVTRAIPRGRTGRSSSTRSSTTSFPDFPLINKSFNLTYSGHDLVSLAMLHILKQIAITGIKSEPPPAPAEEQGRRRAAAGRHPAHTGSRAGHTPCGRRLLQRLRARDPRPRQPVLQHRGDRHPVRREPAPRRHAPRDRTGCQAHGHRAAAHVRRDAGAQARGRGRRLRLHRRHLRRDVCEPRARRQRDPGRCRDPGLPANAGCAPAGHRHGARGAAPARGGRSKPP